ncbi:MAG: BTAD domain-containing putative transcriptional regulator [Acidimicrobiia bacterium]
MALEYRILGPLEVVRDGRPLRLERPRERALLALLVLSANRVVSADTLAEDLWAGDPPASAAATLRVYISRLRQALGEDGDSLWTRPPGYRLQVDEQAVDTLRFEALCTEGRQRAAAGDHAEAAQVLRQALGLWRGAALPEVADAPMARAEAARLEEARLAALEDRIEADLAMGSHRRVTGELEALTGAHPLRERLWALRMLALYRSGRHAEALRAYQELRRLLADELGLEPGEAVRELEAAILRQDPSLEIRATKPAEPPATAVIPPEPAPAPRTRGPERKQVTVLFADVVDSMKLTATMDLEDWGDLMGRFFAILRDGVTRFDGHVDKFTGDGIMALFGAPVAYEDHARQACAAALHLRDALADYRRQLERERGITFNVRMGLNSGEVVAGPIDDEQNVEYTAVGTTVGLAQRMESLAEPGTVYVTPATAALVEGYFELRDLGPMEPKGSGEPITVFELVSRGLLRTPLEVAAARGFSPFVGRAGEMAALDAAFARAAEGNGQVVGVVAGPGLGKSRLCHEFAESCRARGVDVFSAHALAHASSVPFLPVLEILRAQFGITETDDAVTSRAAIERAVLDLDSTLAESLPLLFDFLGVSDPERPLPVMDPEARQRQLFGSLNRLRRARSDRDVFVIVAEDLHWLDPGSEAFLENVVNATPGTRLLVVTTFRPEYRAPWAHRSHYGQLPLSPLGMDASTELLGDLLGHHPSLDGMAELVRERCGGNPFFIQEVVQSLVEDGSLVGGRGAYELVRTIGDLSIPATVQAVLAARVDRLPERDKTLLQTASVIGRQFSGALAGRVAGLADHELEASLRSLLEGEFVYETATYPEEEYAFKHALTEEVAYRSQLAKHRARTHAAVAGALAEVDADKLDERASLIAHHYERGGDLAEAARWNARAAAWAGISHPVEATRRWRLVRALADRLEPLPETVELGLNARLQLLGYHWRLGAASEEGSLSYENEAAQIFAEAEEMARAAGGTGMRVFILVAYAAVEILTARIQEGFERTVAATRIADEAGDPALRTVTRTLLDWGLFVLGRIREATDVTREMEAIVGDDRSIGREMVIVSPYAYCRMHLAQFGTHFGRLDDGLAALERAAELAAEERDFESEAWAHRHWAIFADWAGADPDAAAAHARMALQWADQAGGAWSRIYVREGVATSHAQRGEWSEAITVVDEALAMARDRRIALANVPLLLSIRARALLGQGDVAGARCSAEEAVATAVRVGTGFYEAQARHQLGRALLAVGEPEAARDELQRALSIVETFGLTAYAPQVHLDRAAAARAGGDKDAEEQELRTAHRLFLEAGAPARAAEALALVGS